MTKRRYRVTYDRPIGRQRTFSKLTDARAFAAEVGGRVSTVERKRKRR